MTYLHPRLPTDSAEEPKNHGYSSVAVGPDIFVSGSGNVAIGSKAVAGRNRAGEVVGGRNNVTIGADANSTGNNSIAIGAGATSVQLGAAIGTGATAIGDTSSAIPVMPCSPAIA